MTGSYLARRGKALLRQEPGHGALRGDAAAGLSQAKFICLYRDPMDVIASGMEACRGG